MRALTRSVVALSVSLVLISAGTVSASPVPNAQGPLSLAGVTHVTADRSASVRVTLPRDVIVSGSPFFNEVIQIRSDASFAAVVLKEDVDKGGAELLSYRIERCVKAPCKVRPLKFTTNYDPDQEWHREMKLPSGDYRLFVITDGGTVNATLTLDGLEGTTRLHPEDQVLAQAGSMDPYLQTTQPDWQFSGAADHKIGHMGISMTGIVLELKDVNEGEMDSCFSEDPAGVGAPRPRWEACLSAGSSMAWGGMGMRRVVIADFHLTGEGDYTHSLNYRSPPGVKAARAFHFVLDYGSGNRRGGLSGGVSSGGR